MIVDTSALVAILQNEPDADVYVQALAQADSAAMSHGTLVELSIVLWRRFGASEADVRALLDEYGITVAFAEGGHAWVAAEAYRKWGPTSGTAARLNVGDCFAYALAAAADETLLFKGADFAATDIRPAVSSPSGPPASVLE